MDADDISSLSPGDDMYGLSLFMRDYVFKNPFNKNQQDPSSSNSDNSNENTTDSSDTTSDRVDDVVVVDSHWGHIVDTSKAHYGSNLHYYETYKNQTIPPKYRKVKKWLEKNYKYSAEYPKMRTHHSIIMRDVKQLFPYITNRILSRILSITYKDCKKVISKSEGMYYTSLVKKPSDPIFMDERVKNAITCISKKGISPETAAAQNCIQTDLLKRICVWTDWEKLSRDQDDVELMVCSEQNSSAADFSKSTKPDMIDSVFNTCATIDSKIKDELDPLMTDNSNCSYNDSPVSCNVIKTENHLNLPDLKKNLSVSKNTDYMSLEKSSSSIVEIKPEGRDISSSKTLSNKRDDITYLDESNQIINVETKIVDDRIRLQVCTHSQIPELDVSQIKKEEDEILSSNENVSMFTESLDMNLCNDTSSNTDFNSNDHDYLESLRIKILNLQNELSECKNELAQKEHSNKYLRNELDKSNTLISYYESAVSERDGKLKSLSNKFEDVQTNLTSIQGVFDAPLPSMFEFQN